MIVYLPLLGFAIGLSVAYRSTGRRRHAATLLMVLAVVWALALLINPGAAVWGIGPLLATLLLPRPQTRLGCSFEMLTRRTITIAALMLLALFLALRFPVGENPVFLSLVPWALGGLGAAWVVNPIDARERLQGQVLMIAATGALVQMAIPAGPVTAGAAGAMALVPWLGELVIARHRGVLLRALVIGLAFFAAIVAISGLVVSRQTIGDLGLLFSGSILFGVAVVLLGAALAAPPGTEWSGLVGALALIAAAPALRWSAIAALIAVATLTEQEGERPAWIGLAALAGAAVVQGLASASLSPRLQTVALGIGLFMTLYAARAGLLRAVVVPAIGFLVLIASQSLTDGNVTRFQWILAAGALLLIGRGLLSRMDANRSAHPALGEALTGGLLLLAIGARDALTLGALASALLLIDLAVVRPASVIEEHRGLAGRIVTLARSTWPPSIRFAGATLAVVAALQASLVLGLMAALMLGGLHIAPLLDQTARQRITERPQSALRWLVPALSLSCGIAPAVVLRMLRL